GHAIVWRAVGLDIDEILVRGHGAAAHGHVWLVQTETEIRTVDQERAVHTGLVAGRVAQLEWCRSTDVGIDVSCATDDRLYRARRHTPLGREVNPSTVHADATRLVRMHWRSIARLAPLLAEAGRLSPRRLPR
ncbi:hypothetical protein, partial [Actinophytocola sp.]|uniref:hypothetical protein n=1 Tax=Actinophytocola sp. TaxID=1872138 RepID=UPI002ED4E685